MSGTAWWRRLFGRKDEAGETGSSNAPSRAPSRQSSRTASRPSSTPASRPARPGRRPQVDTTRGVLGVVPVRTGWVAAALDASGHGTPAILHASSLAELVARPEAGEVTVVGASVPLGLPDSTKREADTATRRFLGDKGSAVVNAPLREAAEASTYGEANAVSRERVGSGVAKQAYELRRHILEADHYQRGDLPFTLVEVHPEASLAELGGAPVASRKKSAEGAQARRELLAGAGIYVPTSAPVGVATDEMIDACAAAWSAHRVKTGAARTFPEDPETFSDGIAAAIHV